VATTQFTSHQTLSRVLNSGDSVDKNTIYVAQNGDFVDENGSFC